jgi:hypothetical protein
LWHRTRDTKEEKGEKESRVKTGKKDRDMLAPPLRRMAAGYQQLAARLRKKRAR